MQHASMRVRVTLLSIGLATGFLGAQAPTPAPLQPDAPRLIVLVVVDQFRADYFDLYGRNWTGGLRRLFDKSARFPLAAYPYGGTVTCAGHATIGTGSFPKTHGMIGNTWFDPATEKSIACTADAAANGVGFGGGAATEHHSPRALAAPALADELRLQAPRLPKILSLSLKPRSAIGLGGHGGPGTMVVWEEDNGTWATSSSFISAPWPDVDAYVTAHPLASAYGQTWTKILPPAAYLFEDDAPGEASPAPWGRTFPHKLESAAGKPDTAFVNAWERSPWSDAYLADMAASLLTSLKLGQTPGTDMLAVSFSALDLIGHEFGPHSHEVQDTLARLDLALGKLLDALDRQVGPTRYVLGFSADHGAAPLPEEATARGMDAGRITIPDARLAVQGALVPLLGEGTYFANLADHTVYLAPGVGAKLAARPELIEAVRSALLGMKGVARVYTKAELASAAPTNDSLLASWRLSYFPGRTGEFVVVPKPYWITRATGTTHGTPYAYDQRVPMMLMGARIKPGEYLTTASPADLAPTLAFLSRIALADADGRVLAEAIR